MAKIFDNRPVHKLGEFLNDKRLVYKKLLT